MRRVARAPRTLALLAPLLLAACGEPAPPRLSTAPIAIVDLPGLEAALAERRGEGFLLNFWAMWCPPCVDELPELVEVAGDALVGVSFDLMVPGADRDGMEGSLRRFLGARGLELAVLVYDADDYDALNARFDLPGDVPVTLAIDARGAVVDREEGRASAKRFAAMLARARGTP